MASKAGPGRVIVSESCNEVHMADLHAYLAIYGWTGSPGGAHNTMHCRTTLAFQVRKTLSWPRSWANFSL